MPLYSNGRGNCRICGYPLDVFHECGACNTRAQENLPVDARCGTCKSVGKGRCAFSLRNAVCSRWVRQNVKVAA